MTRVDPWRDCPHGYGFDCCTQCHDAYRAGFADGVRSIGRKGGAKTSESKTRAARENGRKGGRPRLPTKEDTRRSEEDMS